MKRMSVVAGLLLAGFFFLCYSAFRRWLLGSFLPNWRIEIVRRDAVQCPHCEEWCEFTEQGGDRAALELHWLIDCTARMEHR